MKNKLINTLLIISLLIPLYLIYLHWNDNTMQMKHWVIIMMTEIILQIIIERDFRKNNNLK